MNELSINKNPSSWNKEGINGLKISALNCNSLRSKMEDVRKDFELCLSDMICLSETWLEETDELIDLQMDNYLLHVTSVGRGKGLVTYFKRDLFIPEIDVKEEDLQISKFASINLDVISIYRSKNCKSKFEDILKNILSKDRATLILGDINICYEKQRIDQNIQYLKSNNFKQLVKGSNHFLGGHINHAYFFDPKLKFEKVD
jgi:exonuclease III